MEDPRPERRFKLTMHYDGAAFSGWQVQPGERTVQGELEGVLARLASGPVSVIAAGRTDSGVHALGQVASATLPAKWTPPDLQRALNALLPPEVWVETVEEVPDTFHARYDARARGYVYRIGLVPSARSPFRRRWCWPLQVALDHGALNAAAEVVLGEHRFGAFAKTGQPERGERCVVYESRWMESAGGVEYRVVANRFLHHMVRYLVGTMVEIARGFRPSDDMSALLERAEGLETSPPAPASGLFLARVYYSDGPFTLETNHEVLP